MGTAHERTAPKGKTADMSLFALRQLLPVRDAVRKLEATGRGVVTLADIAAACPKRTDGKAIQHADLRKGITQFLIWISLKGVGTPISTEAAARCKSVFTFGQGIDRLIAALGGQETIEAVTACTLPGGFQVQRMDNERHIRDEDGTGSLLSRICRFCLTYCPTDERRAIHLESKAHQRTIEGHPRYREGMAIPAAFMTEWGAME